MIKVTVIMPSLNVAPYIEECICSVENQTLSDIEILCIDAGSTDGTLEILKKHAENDYRIRIINSSVKSYGYQINLGIREAKGEYIDIVETDDSVSLDMLETLYSAADHEADYVKSNFYRVSHIGNKKILAVNNTIESIGITPGKTINPAEHRKAHLSDGSIWAGIFRRKFLVDNNIILNETKGAAFQDIGFAHQVLSWAESAVYLDEPMYFYKTDREDASTWNKNCLVYTIQEYKRLFEEDIIPAERFNANRSAIDMKMYFAVIGEVDKVINMTEGPFDISSIAEPYEWFKDRVDKEITAGYFGFDYIGKDQAADLKLMLEDLSSYVKLIKAKNELSQGKWKRNLVHIDGRNVIVFGSGIYGKSLIEYFIKNPDAEIDAVTDNDSIKWGTTLDNVNIESPDTVINDYGDDCFIVANKYHTDDICGQLKDKGIPQEHIMIWNRDMELISSIDEESENKIFSTVPQSAKKKNTVKYLSWSIFGWYPFRAKSRILYIGKSKDIICKMLTEKRHIVSSRELSDLTEKMDISDSSYDYIICVEKLEEERNPEKIMEIFHKILAKEGVLLLGMNNRYGLRYLCGEHDPHTGHTFDGIEDYKSTYIRPDAEFIGRCYSAGEIRKMSDESGFRKCKLYSVLPTLEDAHFLFSEDYLPNEDLANRVTPEYSHPESVFLKEERIYDGLVKEGMFHQMADAYLAECTVDGSTADVNSVTGSIDRGEERAVYTITNGNSSRVTKQAIFDAGKKRLSNIIKYSDDLKAHGIATVDLKKNEDGSIVMPYIDAPTGQHHLKEAAQKGKEEFIEAFDEFRDMILKSSEIVIQDRNDGMGVTLEHGYLDMVPLNSFYKDGRYIMFDQEYREENCRANVIIMRMITTVYAFDPYFDSVLDQKVLFDRYGLTEHMKDWKEYEIRFLGRILNRGEMQVHNDKMHYDNDTLRVNRQRMDYSDEDYRKIFTDIFDNADTRKLILFGSGDIAATFVDIYGHDFKIYGIVDNDRERWGSKLGDITVSSPDALRNMLCGGYKVMICDEDYRMIMHQLKDIGVTEYSVFDPHRCYAESGPLNRATLMDDRNIDKAGDGVGKPYHIGYISGTFDLFHVGHLNLLKSAKERCDYLIVGVVSDEGVRKYKNVEPFVPFEERIEIIRSCRYVDRAVEIPLEAREIEDAYRKYKFDCQFCGSDYVKDPAFKDGKKWLEERGSDLVILPYTKSTNSSRIKASINRELSCGICR